MNALDAIRSADGDERARLAKLYLDELEPVLTGQADRDPAMDPVSRGRFDPAKRREGADWPAHAHTMIGQRRLRSLRQMAEAVIERGIPGDFIETGVWRGGACILMRAVLAAHGVTDRRVFVADSFQGLPSPDTSSYPLDAEYVRWPMPQLAVPLEEVKRNFAHYGLLDDQVVFLPGWFRDTLPIAPIDRLAILRLDGDMYQSTTEALEALFPKLSAGGYLIVDDGHLESCMQAVKDFRARHRIKTRGRWIDRMGFYWIKEQDAE